MQNNSSTPFRYTHVPSKLDHEARSPRSILWDEFCRVFIKYSLRAAASKDGPAVIPATFSPGGRIKDENVVTVTALGLDIDGEVAKGQTFLAVDDLHALLPFAGIAYSTYSSTPARPKYRAIMPFEQELTTSDFLVMWHWANQITGGKLMDPACKNASRLYYTPRSPAAALAAGWPWAKVLEGPLLSMAAVPVGFRSTVDIPERLQGGRREGARQGVHAARPDQKYSNAVLDRVLAHPVLRWAQEEPGDVTREVWRGIATNLICAAEGYPELLERAEEAFDEVSMADEARYRRVETLKTWSAALASAAQVGPMTFKHMVEHGLPEELCSRGATCLVHAARRSLTAEGALTPATPHL